MKQLQDIEDEKKIKAQLIQMKEEFENEKNKGKAKVNPTKKTLERSTSK